MRRTLRNKIGGAAAALLMAGLSLGVTASAADARPAPAGAVHPLDTQFHQIKNTGSNLCLQPDSTIATAAVVQEPCDGGFLQGWQFNVDGGTNHFYFVNQATGFCLDAFDGAFNGARVLNNDCGFLKPTETISNDEWNTGQSLPAVTKIESRVHFRDTGFCMDVPGGSHDAGVALQVFSCNGTPAQIFVVGF
ncbi:MAG: RICIN domain-containing protein [Mycobacteriales bacterium]